MHIQPAARFVREDLSLSSGTGDSSLLPLRLFARCPRVEIAFQRFERVGPHRLVLRNPFIEFGEALGVELVDALLRVDRDVDEACVAEYLQVSRDARLAEARELGRDRSRV